MNKIILIIFSLVILLIISAWTPWLSGGYAEEKAMEKFSSGWEGIADGCGFSCEGCGVESSHKSLFGYYVAINFGCGFVEKGESGRFTDELFVSLLGTVHGSALHKK